MALRPIGLSRGNWTAFRTYYTEFKARYGVLGNEVFLGPQFIALGNERFDQWRVGLHLSGIKLGKLRVWADICEKSDLGSGAYGATGANIQF